MPIRISAELSHICPLEEVVAHATALEAHGFHRVWIPDTVVSAWEAWMAASLILQHTQRIQVGLGGDESLYASSGRGGADGGDVADV